MSYPLTMPTVKKPAQVNQAPMRLYAEFPQMKFAAEIPSGNESAKAFFTLLLGVGIGYGIGKALSSK